MRHADILARAAAGDADGLTALYVQHGEMLFRLAYRLTGSVPDAEDVVHDLFVGLPELLRRYEERGQLAPWLRRVTVRLTLMRMRQERRRREIPLDNTQPAVPSGRDGDPHAIDLHAAIDALPSSLRAVFVLKQLEGYSHDEIGELLGVSAGASRVRHLRALRQLRQILERDR